MSLIAATAIAVKDDLPYFLVEKNSETYHFFTAKMHRHNHDTSLGAVLRAFKALGPIDFDQWRLGELTSVKNNNTLMSLYAFEVSDMNVIEKNLIINLCLCQLISYMSYWKRCKRERLCDLRNKEERKC
ncbi:hypothetical protein GCM10025884_14220 [Leuconostoc gelidum subsp. gelidum]|nr:hypothetical protein GCM10025884_14220 [Leuconostoc gelidum subsp. gelidum]